jgi:riboflavin kinase/FMN adenylyltransferase
VEQKGEISIEVHIFQFEGNLYNESISIDFIEKLRDEQHFDSLEDLQKQLTLDARAAQAAIYHST